MEMSDTFAELQGEIERFDLLAHPFYRAWSAGELKSEDLCEYAAAYYHHVAAFPTYLSSLHSGLPDGKLRRAVLRNLAEEEIDGDPHSEMWLDFAESFGACREDVKNGEPPTHMHALIEKFRQLMRSCTGGLAALYVYESQVPMIAREKARGLRESYGATDRACRYFDVHTTADIVHSHVWKEELKRLLDASPELGEQAVHGGRGAAEALWKALDGIEEGRQARLATTANGRCRAT